MVRELHAELVLLVALAVQRREAGVVVHRAQNHQARAGVHGFVEALPRARDHLHAEALEQAGRVEIAREFVLEREDAIAGMPIEPRKQQAESGGSIRNERDVTGRAADQPGDLGANAIGVVIPREKVPTG